MVSHEYMCHGPYLSLKLYINIEDLPTSCPKPSLIYRNLGLRNDRHRSFVSIDWRHTELREGTLFPLVNLERVYQTIFPVYCTNNDREIPACEMRRKKYHL